MSGASMAGLTGGGSVKGGSKTLRATVYVSAGPGEDALVLIDGSDTPVTARGLASYTPTVGDRLLVQQVDTSVEILQFLMASVVPYGLPDGVPPTSSPTPVLTPQGVDGLRWEVTPSPEAIANGDRRRIYAAPSSEGTVTTDAAHLVADTTDLSGSFNFIGSPAWTPVSAGSSGAIPTYIAVCVEYDADGDAPVSATSDAVAPRRADIAQFLNGFEARGNAKVATGGQVSLASSQSDPSQAPSAWQYHDLVALATATKPSGASQSTHAGATEPVWDAANNRWLVAALWKISSTQYRLYIYQDVSPFGDGTWVATDVTLAVATDWSFMHAFIHGTRLVVGMVAGVGGNWFAHGFLLSNLTTLETRNGTFGTAITNADGMTVGSDGTDLIFAKIAPTTATHEGVSMVANDIYGHRRPVTVNAGNLTTGFVLGSIAQSWDFNQACNPAPNGVRKLKSVLTARAGSTVTFDYSSVVAFKSLTSNVATLKTTAPHSFIVGDSVTVAGVDATFNGTYTITAITASSFSYAKVASNVTEVASGGTAVWASSHVIILAGDTTGIGGFNITNCVFTCADSTGPTNATFRGGWYSVSAGIAWNSTDGYLYCYDAANFRLEKQHHNKQGGYWNISYTFSDDNATGGRHESLRSPEYRMGGWARSKTTIQSGVIPTAGGTDDPNGVRFYIRHDSASNVPARAWRVGTGNGHVTATPGGFAQLVGLDDVFPLNADAPAYSVDTGLTQAPSTNSYAVGTVGKFVSEGNAGGKGIVDIRGDGTASMPGLAGYIEGLIQPFYKRTCNSAQSVASGSTVLVTNFGTVVEDGGSWSYSAGTFTCIKAGLYDVSGGVGWAANTTGFRNLNLNKNGNSIVGGGSANWVSAIQMNTSAATTERFAVGDTFSVTVRQQSTVNLNTVADANTFVALTRVGA